MDRVYNFSAGPSILPEQVLERAQKELLNCQGSGMSVMEMSHRSKAFDNIIKETEQDLRDIMQIPENYKVLFLQGGASLQFAMVPLNLFRNSRKADFIITGAWSKKALKESQKIGEVNILGSSEDKVFSYIPGVDPSAYSPEADFFHITANNTIYGTRYTTFPETGAVPLIADMSSNILSEQMDVSRFGIIYAGAQKNIAPAGLTIVIIRDDLIGNAPATVPTMLNYKTHADTASMFNTPPCFCVYMAGLVFKWIKEQGGITEIEKINNIKAKLLYDFIDESSLFSNPVRRQDRSLMNVTFVTGNDDLNARFVKEAADIGLVTLKGHRSVGGMRASIYNAMPIEGVEKLVEFMKKFEQENK